MNPRSHGKERDKVRGWRQVEGLRVGEACAKARPIQRRRSNRQQPPQLKEQTK